MNFVFTVLKKRYFLALSFLIFFTSLATSLSMPFMSLFLFQRINITQAQLGLFVSVSSFANIIISFFIGYISDNLFDRKKILYIALISSFVSYFLYSITYNFWFIMLISTSIMGVSSAVTPQLFALSKQLLNQENDDVGEVNSDLTLLRTMISISWAFGPLIGSYILSKFNFKGVFFLTALIFLVSFFVTFLSFKNVIIRKDDAAPKTKDNKQVVTTSVTRSTALGYKEIIIYFMIFVFAQIINSMVSNVFPIYITDTLGNSNSYVGIISSFTAFIEIPLMIICAILAKKIPIKKLLNVGFISCLVFLILFANLKSIKLIVLSYFFIAVFNATSIGLGIAFFQNMIPKKPGLSTTLFMNTSSFGKILSGGIISVLGGKYSYIFGLLIIVIVCCIILFNVTGYSDEGLKNSN